ncbi:multidrug transporter subunit MdtJ [Shewanella sp. NFH-SH190041]|uniref:DMT family transporter n=1 Tax=Shewanella sp. NFH-SH190041 TaxID=2950245 RepID=UPI0021C3F260|nr:multidrug efflux SMR transporter [Shewanella sp. NFH-SH190041]BDM63122.1 multidrug transporter subunit MdtJ [Shewanella sp. NFH-SH190041]
MARAWLFLLLAIGSEVAATSVMGQAGAVAKWLAALLMYLLIALSYYLLSLAVKKISVSVAYATWEGMGIGIITLLSVFVFQVPLSSQQLLGVMIAIVGIICVNMGEQHQEQS